MKPNSAIRYTLAVVLFLVHVIPVTCLERGNSSRRLRSLQQQSNPITRLELINTLDDTIVTELFDGQVINIQNTGLTAPYFSINAVTTGSVSTVFFGYNGNPNFRKETAAPYAFCGNSGRDFYQCSQLTYGEHAITATAVVSGILSPTISLKFTIVSGVSPVSPPTVITPVATPVTAAPVPTVAPPVTVAPVPLATPVTAAPVPTVAAPVTVAPIPVSIPTSAPIVTTTAPLVTSAPQASLPAIHTLRLMYTGVNPSVPIFNLTFDAVNVVDLQALNLPSGKFNIDALVGPNVKSVTFSNGRTETSKPLAYCGNSGNNFFDCEDLVVGANVTVTVTAYPESGGAGNPILTRSTTINVIRPLPPVAPTPPTVAPVLAPASPPVEGCPLPRLLGKWEGASSGATVPYPIQVAEAQGAMIGNDFVITSGFNGGYSTATPETYALDMFTPNARWRRMEDMPFPLGLTHLGVAVKGMKAYFCGGYVGGSLGIHNGSCFEYDHSVAPGNGQWTNFSSIPDGGRSGGGMIYDSTIDSLVYSAGSHRPKKGSKGAIDFQTTWAFSLNDPAAGWVRKADIPFHGNHMNFVTAFDDKGEERHFFFGGQAGDNEETGNTDEMYEYNAVSDVWTKRQSIPYPLGHAAATARAIGCGFIVAGGRLNTGLTSAITYYDIPTNTWTKIGDLTHKIHTNVCAIANGLLRCETGWATGTFSWKRSISL